MIRANALRFAMRVLPAAASGMLSSSCVAGQPPQIRTEREPPAKQVAPSACSSNASASALDERYTCPSTWPPTIEAEVGGYELVLVPGGAFLLGAGDPAGGFAWAEGDTRREQPQSPVTLAPFYVGRYEVTNAQFSEYVEAGHAAPSTWLRGEPNEPAAGIPWDDAKAYCDWAGLDLPSEAQWEYAARAGTTTLYWSGNGEADLARVAWFDAGDRGPSVPRVHTVGQKPASPWGLYDVHGNVREWCLEKYLPYDDTARDDRGLRVPLPPPQKDPEKCGQNGLPREYGLVGGSRGGRGLTGHIVRGGGVNSTAWHSRSAARDDHLFWDDPYALDGVSLIGMGGPRRSDIGFRPISTRPLVAREASKSTARPSARQIPSEAPQTPFADPADDEVWGNLAGVLYGPGVWGYDESSRRAGNGPRPEEQEFESLEDERAAIMCELELIATMIEKSKEYERHWRDALPSYTAANPVDEAAVAQIVGNIERQEERLKQLLADRARYRARGKEIDAINRR